MRDLKRVYGHFEILHRNKGQELTKVTYSSLDKYNKSPYLQKVVQHTIKQNPHRSITPSKSEEEKIQQNENKVQNSSRHQLPKLATPMKYKEGQVINFFKKEGQGIHNQFSHSKQSIGSRSATLEVNTKKQKLQPINKTYKMHWSCKTKAGTSGKQTKINQDIAIADGKFPYGIKVFGICDGHGLNGHLVSAYIKSHLIKNLNGAFNKVNKFPSLEEVRQIVNLELLKTNKSLLQSDINTQLSGSTVVIIVIFDNKILSFNIGDSRAIVIKQQVKEPEEEEENQLIQNEKQAKNNKIPDKFKQSKNEKYSWHAIPLSIDHKPERQDEHERVIKNGGRIFSQKNQKGEDLGPLRVWMKDLMMPGLAMTRSFGDKAGLKAGTSGDPEILQFDLKEQDKFMVVASDGIWEYLQNQQVMQLLIPFYLKGDLELGGERLVRIASEIWQKVSLSRDDITVVIVSLHAPEK